MLKVNEIYVGDCIDLIKKIDDCTIDVVVTSPPYNKGENKSSGRLVKSVKYDSYKDDISERDYQEKQILILNELHRVIKKDGHIFYNHKNRYLDGVFISPLNWIQKTEFVVRQEIVWNRKIAGNIRGWRFWSVDERIYWLQKKDADKKEIKSNIASLSSVWEIRPQNKNYSKHPCSYPVELVERCLSAVGTKNCLVLDPYIGSGTTAIAAKNLGMNYIGFEISENYSNIAKSRISQETSQLSLF